MDIKQKMMLEIILPFFKNMYDSNFYNRVDYDRNIHGELCVRVQIRPCDLYVFQLKIIHELLNTLTVSEVILYTNTLIEICEKIQIQSIYGRLDICYFTGIEWCEEIENFIYLVQE